MTFPSKEPINIKIMLKPVQPGDELWNAIVRVPKMSYSLPTAKLLHPKPLSHQQNFRYITDCLMFQRVISPIVRTL